jgi:hypothetical protein
MNIYYKNFDAASNLYSVETCHHTIAGASDLVLEGIAKLIARDYVQKTGVISVGSFWVYEKEDGPVVFQFDSNPRIEFDVCCMLKCEDGDEDDIGLDCEHGAPTEQEDLPAFIDSVGLQEYLRKEESGDTQ